MRQVFPVAEIPSQQDGSIGEHPHIGLVVDSRIFEIHSCLEIFLVGDVSVLVTKAFRMPIFQHHRISINGSTIKEEFDGMILIKIEFGAWVKPLN